MSNDSDFWEQQARQNSAKAHTAKLETTSALSDASSAKFKTYHAELETREANQENQSLKSKVNAARAENKKTQAENERYRAILARPLAEILQELTDLKQAYKEQQKLLNKWVVSQKSFRTLAYKFRKELGISDEKIKELVKEEHSKNGKLD